MSWRTFLRTLITTFVVVSVLVYLLIVLVDPYQHVPFSLPLDRAPISTNQRFAYPALARDATFDSVVIGSSTMRLLDPENLDLLLGTRFANLAMNSATAYEQMRIHDLFVRHHPTTKVILIGIDDSWCKRETSYEKYTFREFPEWMFDENPWNDLLYLFNDKALENSVRLLEFVAGKRSPKYEKNGYRDFTLGFGTYNKGVIAKTLYPKGSPDEPRVPTLNPSNDHPKWKFATHELLRNMLRHELAKKAETILVFAPLHGDYLARGAVLYAECKTRLLRIAEANSVRVIDFMIDSEITRVDDNYWDSLHYRAPVARILERDIAAVLRESVLQSSRYRTY